MFTRYVYSLSALLAVTSWLFFVSNGFSTDGILDGVYVIQAGALADGHLFILPGSSEYYHDAMIYHGKYYFYWGLLPSVLLLLFGKIVGSTVAHYLITGIFFFQGIHNF